MAQEAGPTVPLPELLAWLKELAETWAGYDETGVKTILAVRRIADNKWGGGKTEEEVRG